MSLELTVGLLMINIIIAMHISYPAVTANINSIIKNKYKLHTVLTFLCPLLSDQFVTFSTQIPPSLRRQVI